MQNGNGAHDHAARNSMMLFCLGAAVGTTAALLCAPSSGKELRSNISTKAKQAKRKAGDFAGNVMHRADEFKEMATDWTHRTIDKAADAKDKAVSVAKNTVDDASKMIHSAASSSNNQPRQTAQA